MEKCLNCQFYDRQDRSADGRSCRWGQCRRHSPHLSPMTAKTYIIEGVWPSVRDDDWCGEWKAAGAAEHRAANLMAGTAQSALALARLTALSGAPAASAPADDD
jgi:hypothetical protein